MTSIEEEIRSGAVRLVPVEASELRTAIHAILMDEIRIQNTRYGPKIMGDDFDIATERILTALSASPDRTPALLALIEERDRLKVEKQELYDGAREAVLSMMWMPGVRAALDQIPEGDTLEPWVRKANEADQWQARALAAEAKCDALREAAVGAAAALSAAISLLERTPKAAKATPSARMFGQMLSDYRATLEATRCALTKEPDNG